MEILEQQRVRRHIADLNNKELEEILSKGYILLTETKNELFKRRARENEHKKWESKQKIQKLFS